VTSNRHFRSRDALFEEIAVYGWALLADRIAAHARHGGSLHAIRVTLEELVGAIADAMPFIEATGQVAGRLPAVLLPERMRAEREFGALVAGAQARGEARRRVVFELALGLSASARWRPQLGIVVEGVRLRPLDA
jgi:AcrR family transcriptional regulator